MGKINDSESSHDITSISMKEQQLQATYLLHEHLTRSLPTRKENTISKEKSPLSSLQWESCVFDCVK